MLRKWHTGVLGTEGTRSGQQPIKAYIILQIITYSNKRPNQVTGTYATCCMLTKETRPSNNQDLWQIYQGMNIFTISTRPANNIIEYG